MRMTFVRARIGLAALALAAVIAVAVGLRGLVLGFPVEVLRLDHVLERRQARTRCRREGLAAATADPIKQAPDFALRNSNGQLVRLSQYRGKAVMLTFIYSHCPDVCPLIVGNLRAAIRQMGPAASKMQVIAVSVDPKGDTAAYVNKFIAAHDMTGRMSVPGRLQARARPGVEELRRPGPGHARRP